MYRDWQVHLTFPSISRPRPHSAVYKYEVEGTLSNPNQLISRLAKHQSIRALEGLEARLPHLLRGRHKGGVVAHHRHQDLHQQEI